MDSNLYKTLALENLADVQRDVDPDQAVRTLEEAAAIHTAFGNVVGSARVERLLATSH